MLLNTRLVRRAVVGTIGAGAVAGATLLAAVPSALADPLRTAPPRTWQAWQRACRHRHRHTCSPTRT
jgi:hypothetical protein